MINVFFKLIRSGLYGTEINISDLPTEIDWKQLISLAQKQTLLGVMADAVMRLPSSINVPPKVKMNLMESALRIAKSHTQLDNKLTEVVKFYRNNGISTVLLKGQGIARCYRNPLMRQCGDIDLYIGKKNYDKAYRLSQEYLESNAQISYETLKHYHFNTDGIAIDLHHTAATSTVFHNKDFKKWLISELEDESRLRHITINGEQICLPSITFDAFFLFYHAWRHLTGDGIGLRQICDWTMLLNKHWDEIDLSYLEQVLIKYRLMKPWQIFGNIAVIQLGLPKGKMPFYNPKYEKKSQKILNIILEDGNFGFYSNTNKNQHDQKPFLQRNLNKLLKVTRRYYNVVSITPLTATRYFAHRISKGSVRTIAKLFKGQK